MTVPLSMGRPAMTMAQWINSAEAAVVFGKSADTATKFEEKAKANSADIAVCSIENREPWPTTNIAFKIFIHYFEMFEMSEMLEMIEKLKIFQL